jgi:hypothetical protein
MGIEGEKQEMRMDLNREEAKHAKKEIKKTSWPLYLRGK